MNARTAAETIRAGGVILYPTDTLYGLGCDGFNRAAIRRIYEIKRRPEGRPSLLLVRDRPMLDSLVSAIPPLASRLIDRFWPGPLTILFPARSELDPLLTGGAGKVGVRIPDHSFCLKLLAEAGVPIISTSANISGAQPAPDMEGLRSQFGGLVDLFIDAGPPASATPSTVVDVSGGSLEIVREGAIAAGAIRECVAG